MGDEPIQEIQENDFPEIKIDKEELMEVIKLKDNPIVEKPKKGRRKKADLQDMSDMTGEEFAENSKSEIEEMYDEIASFVQSTTDLEEDDGVKMTIPTNLKLLNATLSGDPHHGGFASGSLNTIVGNPGCGKTMIITQTLGSAQRYFGKGVIVSFLDSEYATTPIRMANLGVRNPQIRPYSEKGTKRLTVEKVFQFIESVCLYKEKHKIIDVPWIIAWDSIANTLSLKEYEASDPKEVIGYRAKLYSLLIPNYAAKCHKYNICILSVNQLKDLVQMGTTIKTNDLKYLSRDKTIPGGKALLFNAFHFLEMKQLGMTKQEIEKYGCERLVSEITCVKNKLFRPKLPIKVVGDFNTGFSDFWTNFIFMVDNKYIKVAGGWNELVTYPTKKFRTSQMVNMYRTDEIFRKSYEEAVDMAIDEVIVKPNEVHHNDEEDEFEFLGVI